MPENLSCEDLQGRITWSAANRSQTDWSDEAWADATDHMESCDVCMQKFNELILKPGIVQLREVWKRETGRSGK